MDLISLTYTSRATPGLTAKGVDDIHRAAQTYNPLDGVTGLLVYNGRGFLQIIEGAESAIDDLMQRIGADPRHFDLIVRDRRALSERFFSDWGMYRIDTDPAYAVGAAQVARAVAERVDAPMLEVINLSLAEISRTD